MALLLLMLTLTVGAAGLLLSGRAPMSQASAQSSVQAEIDLARAVEALIAYHIADDDNPGALVCPDYHPSGNEGDHDVGCLNNTSDEWFVGRLPWRTLDLPREYGRLWYVIDGDFRDDHNVSGGSSGGEEGGGGSTGPLNPDVDGKLLLDGESGYAAIVFDPGEARADQAGRPSYSVADYLDGDNATQNTSDPTPEFVDCHGMSNCNDRARGIRDDKLFATVQLRVIGELKPLLEAYYDDKGNLPRAAPSGSTECDSTTFVGQIPTAQGGCNPDEYIDLDDLDSPEDDWIIENDWLEYIVYVVDKGCTAAGSGCGSLSVNGEDGVHTVLFGAGADGLDHDKNTDGDDEFVRTPVTHTNNDVARWRYDVERWR